MPSSTFSAVSEPELSRSRTLNMCLISELSSPLTPMSRVTNSAKSMRSSLLVSAATKTVRVYASVYSRPRAVKVSNSSSKSMTPSLLRSKRAKLSCISFSCVSLSCSMVLEHTADNGVEQCSRGRAVNAREP